MYSSWLRLVVCTCKYNFQYAGYTRLEHARKPSNKSSLLSKALGALASDPLFGEHLHCPIDNALQCIAMHIPSLLHSQDALVQLLSIGGPWKFLSTITIVNSVIVRISQFSEIVNHFIKSPDSKEQTQLHLLSIEHSYV